MAKTRKQNRLVQPGDKFGRAEVICDTGKRQGTRRIVLCQCDCGNQFETQGRHLTAGRTKSCGCLKGELARARMWKGGRKDDGQGYVLVHQPDHPNADANGYVREHIKVMADSVGRPLRPEETVHHKNGVRSDNRIDNLELWASNHPPGQRVSDLIAWARDILQLYGGVA